jgi:hypothetical protein
MISAGPLTVEALVDDARRRLGEVQRHAQALLDGY